MENVKGRAFHLQMLADGARHICQGVQEIPGLYRLVGQVTSEISQRYIRGIQETIVIINMD